VALVVGSPDAVEESSSTLHACVQTAFSDQAYVVGTSGDKVLVLIQAEESNTYDAVAECFDRLCKIADRNHLTKLTAGCGSALKGLEGVRRSRSEAQILLSGRLTTRSLRPAALR
jgi:hypothetical protein